MDTCRFQIVSDLHLETHPSYDVFELPQTAPNLALLGDIGHIEKAALFSFLERQLRRYKVVFFLLGNHEPYHMSIDSAKRKVANFISKIDDQRQSSPSLGEFIFLDQKRYDLTDNVTVLGCTLFSRVTSEQAYSVQSRLVDFKDILHWDVSEHVDAHLSDLAWLNAQVTHISQAEPHRRVLIFTHHSPCSDNRATNPRHRNSSVNSGFVTDLSAEKCWKNTAVALWAFGHTHYNCDFIDELGKRVVANQKGYYMVPQSSFDASKLCEIQIEPDNTVTN